MSSQGGQASAGADRESLSALNLFQSPFWAAHKERFGWKPLAASDGTLLLFRRLGGPFTLLYLPYGGTAAADGSTHLLPPVEFDLSRFLGTLEEACRRQSKRLTFLRWDVPFPSEALTPERLRAAGMSKAVSDVQPPDTVVLDLRPGEEALLAGMKGKTRYNVRLSEKRGVRVELANPEKELSAWYQLYRLTALRDRIAIHSYDYYRSLFELARVEDPEELSVRLYLAYHEKSLLAGIITARYRKSAYYLYGASSNEKRNLMPSYALQWRAIRDARGEGAESYDFFGIPPAQEPDHPMHGLYRFKVGFGGSILHRPGAWDLPINPIGYRGFRLAEGLRTYYYKVLRKRGG